MRGDGLATLPRIEDDAADEGGRRSPIGRPWLRAVTGSGEPPPYDDVILQQIRETVERVTERALWAAPGGDALISAEDIAQDTIVTLHQRGQPADVPNLVAWAIGIARLKLKEARRYARMHVPQVPLATDDIAVSDPDEQTVGIMHYTWLLDQLVPIDRMIVEWRQAGYSSREIAEMLSGLGSPHMTANNVDQRFYRALKTLRTRLFAEESEAPSHTQGQPGNERSRP
jgi:DNA-directed RNA polymerase specialized sigma24 family protein